MSVQQFVVTLQVRDLSKVFLPIPFNPKETWGTKPRYHVKGTLRGTPFTGSLGVREGRYFMPVNKELQAKAQVKPGEEVAVEMELNESPQQGLPTDLAEALQQSPQADAFFHSLSSFYQNSYVKWIEMAKKEETRADRISQTIQFLTEGKKQK